VITINESFLINVWNRLPVLIKAILLGFIVNSIGVYGWLLIVIIVPQVLNGYWLIPIAIFYLILYFTYFSGISSKNQTLETRRRYFRTLRPSMKVWKYGLISALFFVIIMQALFVLTFRLVQFPGDEFTTSLYLNDLSLPFAITIIVLSSLFAGICEEVGLRGYGQVPLEEEYGAIPAILITSIAFFMMHLHQAWMTNIMISVFLIGLMLGIMAYTTRSLLPGIIGHTVADIINFSYWWSDIGGRYNKAPISLTGIDLHFIVWLLILFFSILIFYLSNLNSLGAVRKFDE